jgi:hypothetical protein
LRQARDAPAIDTDRKRQPRTKRELIIRGLVERAAGADLAATKLLLEMIHKADPRAIARHRHVQCGQFGGRSEPE